MADREEKQKYLRQNVDMDQYQDFADYCQNQAGQIDIDQWSFQYVRKLVDKYKASKVKQQQQHQHQRSFANYQTADIQQAFSIVSAISTSQQQSKQDIPRKSATDLLDSVFQVSEKAESVTANNSPTKSTPQNNQFEKQFQSSNSSTISVFENANIWSTTSNVQNSRKSAQFDNFWQFPTTSANKNSPPQFKTYNPNSKTNNVTSFQAIKQAPVVVNEAKINENLTFDQLSKNLNMTKKSNPYIQQAQKPSNMKKELMAKQVPVVSTPSQSNLSSKTAAIKLISQRPLSVPKPGSISSAYKMNKILYQGPCIHKTSFNDTVKCYQAGQRPQLNDNRLVVTIDKHQIVERNFFVADYVMYSLTVKPIGIVTKRNYQDFTKLRSALEKVYPGAQLPYLQKNSWFQTNLENIKNQKAMLQFFLHDIVQNPQIRNSRIFQDFLMLKQHKAMKRKFQQYSKMDKFKGIQQLCVLNGKVDIVINQNQRIYHEQIGKYVDTMQDLLSKQTKLMQTLGEQFNAVNQTLANLAKLSTCISEQVKKFNQRVSQDQITSMQSTFNIISKSFEQWASRINFESKVVTKRLIPFYRYQKDNITTLRQVIDCQAALYKSYVKRVNSQNSEDTYMSDRLKPFKTGVLEQSKNITILKYQLGYMSNMLCKESARFFQLMADNFKAKWIYKADKYKERLSKDMHFYSSIAVMTV